MISIKRSPTADTRTCDFAQVSKEQLRLSSEMHIRDVRAGMLHFAYLLIDAGNHHDHDKVSGDGLDWFHDCFTGGFKDTGWWDNHRKVNRHHLNMSDGVRDDVDLVDVIDHIVDCVMAGAARSSEGTAGVYDIEIDPEILQRAVKNTADKLKAVVTVTD